MQLSGIHHVAIICSDYKKSKVFYTEILGLKIIAENFRQQRNSYKLDLALPNGGQIELFSFPSPPARANHPEAAGLRHLAFVVQSVEQYSAYLASQGVDVEPVRVDEYTGRKYTFFADPDGLPLELYEDDSGEFFNERLFNEQ
nr:VOC family protein [Marinibactrum halimedae]